MPRSSILAANLPAASSAFPEKPPKRPRDRWSMSISCSAPMKATGSGQQSNSLAWSDREKLVGAIGWK